MVSFWRVYQKSKFVKLGFISIAMLCLFYVNLEEADNGYYQEDVTLRLEVKTGEIPQVRLPQAFILGAGKCGTAALHKFLSIHPKIVTPLLGEMEFYDHHYRLSEAWHKARLRPSKSDQITLENSPGYFHNILAMERIIKMNRSAKFIVILREPVQRAISQYLHFKRKTDNLTFEFTVLNQFGKINEKLDVISYGVYVKPMERWLKEVSLRQFFIVDGNAFIKNPVHHLKAIERFLHLPRFFKQEQFVYIPQKQFYCLKPALNGNVSCLSKHKGRKHPAVKPRVLNILKAYYKPHNDRLFELIGRRFDWGY